ncbi:hypothetical protein M1N52_04215 [Thermodesulfovibrionales bacterium]|nr:hypothetical protein [Thermodesulfovibrionales bacterium]MCL0086439.1 hypothetical protein [Thermodesulfovibrionales bacterium]
MKDLLEANKMIKAAVDELTTSEALKSYEVARKWELDYNDGVSAARKGGIQQGIQQGRREERQLVINNMLKEGYTLDEIQEVTGTTKTQIKELQEKTEQTLEMAALTYYLYAAPPISKPP